MNRRATPKTGAGQTSSSDEARRLPRVDHILAHPALAQVPWERELCRRATRDVLDRWRVRLLAAAKTGATLQAPELDACAHEVARELEDWTRIVPRRVLNCTGTLLHTNIGRSPLSSSAIAAMVEAAGCCDLEVELKSGLRGSRMTRVCRLLARVLDVPDVLVVNNGAAAILLVCTALGVDRKAKRKGVVLSRGQMVEIGDGFRVATMMAAGGVPVIEVGSTNRTHAADYARVLQPGWVDDRGRERPAAAALTWVHGSNFSQAGYVKEVPLAELSTMARGHGVPLIADLGSGSLGKGIPEDEPTVMAYLQQGADLVTFSGDKLLGGPQAGVIAGHPDLIARCRKHPMARALRPDKTTVAALHATLVAHARVGVPDLPLQQMLGASIETLQARGARIMAALNLPSSCMVASRAVIGGGSLPGQDVESRAIVLPWQGGEQLARALRLAEPAVIGVVREERVWLDLRSLSEDEGLIDVLLRVAGERGISVDTGLPAPDGHGRPTASR